MLHQDYSFSGIPGLHGKYINKGDDFWFLPTVPKRLLKDNPRGTLDFMGSLFKICEVFTYEMTYVVNWCYKNNIFQMIHSNQMELCILTQEKYAEKKQKIKANKTNQGWNVTLTHNFQSTKLEAVAFNVLLK